MTFSQVKTGIDTLQNNWFNASTGLWRTASWWESANSLTVLCNYMSLTGDHAHLGVLETVHSKHASFINPAYDDCGWWALAWVAAYDLTHDSTYLQTAETLWSHMVGAWDNTCRGGLWWTEARSYKNAIPNELFLALSTALYIRTHNVTYLNWANNEWNWFWESGLINSEHLINDGLAAGCVNNNGGTFTYNQGVIIGGLARLHAITNDATYVNVAHQIATAAITKLVTAGGILADAGESAGEGGSGPQFKGIFIRNLVFWKGQPAYKDFIIKNAESIWNNNRNTANEFGIFWAGPFSNSGAPAVCQTSALDCLIEAASLGW